jgi:hypothetical protein
MQLRNVPAGASASAAWAAMRWMRSASGLAGPAPGRSPAVPDNGLVIQVEPGRFEDMVATALDGLPEELGQMMRNVAVTVEHNPGPPGLLGLYEGVPLTSRTSHLAVCGRAARPDHHLPASDLHDLPQRARGRRPGPPHRHPRDRPPLRH